MSSLFKSDDAQPSEPVVGFVTVAVERRVDVDGGRLTYAVPASLADLAPGQRVLAPLGRGDKPVSGYITARQDQPPQGLPAEKIKPLLGRDTQGLSLTPDLMKLAQWMARYYCAPLGMVFATMLPAAVKAGTGTRHKTFVRLPPETLPETSPQQDSKVKLTSLQQQIVDAARSFEKAAQAWVEISELRDEAGAKTTGPVKRLIDHGVLETKTQDVVESELDLRAAKVAEPTRTISLNESQQRALDHIVSHLGQGFAVDLLHGVTGSGKTEVYLRAIERLRKHLPGAGVIVLVPEIALTPQTVGRFLGRFDDVAVLHSGLTQAQRHAQWRRVERGEASIVVGARSALFAPVKNLSLIIVDEEHEPSYKQDQVPRYHGRDAAIKRSQLLGIPIVLGSATPSLESYANATHDAVKHFHYVPLPDRVPGMALPKVEMVDMMQERRKRYEMTGKGGIHLLSLRMEQLLRQTLDHNAQAILFLNRRGYANYIACPDQNCGWLMTCNHCDTTMVYHKGDHLPHGGVVRCHHCGIEQKLPTHCPTQGCGKKLTLFGIGTQRVEEEIRRKLPDARFARMDSDTMRTARDYQQTLDAFRAGEIDLLLGTQMIAKGLDFPGVQLVGVVSADTALNMPDFRAGERTFQLISQVAGRAGRSDQLGRVAVQSFNVEDPVIQLAAEHDYLGFADRELGFRREARLPPVARMARIVTRHREQTEAMRLATELASHLEKATAELNLDIRLHGPMPCAIARIADHHRMQVELLADPPNAAAKLQQLMAALRSSGLLVSDATTAVDVDPVMLL